MTCDHFRCWRGISVYIPGLGKFCSSHALVGLGTFAMRHVRESETRIKESRRRPSGLAA